ncbi:thiamine phosphate synthase [Bacillus sp. T33-2]|uniref:thiamine phosphate synthase n=1 Tax=Bacillus sp. T33-2 TaxID=2054168 RepID=UPI000C75ED04|nr:thiamine phosphate synthase [Bacillus sp. T33-2]PLR95229.1 thiamine phosphate synthase [Bacillus sp. T33-2]
MGRMSREALRQAIKLYFIMGSANCTKKPADVLNEAIRGGITLFQFREKGEGAVHGDAKVALAKELNGICNENRIPFIVNDDIELAILIGADGVHIGQEDEPAQKVREKIGDKILGVSVHSYHEGLIAIEAGADYFGLGPIFPTSTKTDATAVQGVSLIQEFRGKGLKIPIVGIGGITEYNARSVIEAGADGVSVITAISKAPSAFEAAQKLRRATEFQF